MLAKRARLKQLLHGDMSLDEIVIYAHPDVFDVNQWAEDLSRELLPGSIKCFPRTRWGNGADSDGAYTLLANVYNLLQRVGLRWINEREAKSAALRQAAGVQRLPVVGAFALPESEEDEPADGPPQPDGVVSGLEQKAENPSELWAKFNQKQRKSSRRCLLSKPQHRLVVAHVSIDLFGVFLAVC